MSNFKDIQIKKEYRTPRDNIVNDFYIPLLKESILYKRSVGFFSSSALIELSYGINHLINNGGKIQLVASPNLSKEDIEAINKGYEIREDVVERALMRYITEPQNYFEEERLNILATLIAQGNLDIKIAFSQKNNFVGLYHEKLGIMYDKESNVIAFSGSLNETENALVNNYETIDVFKSWDEDDRVSIKEKAFDALWSNEDKSAYVFDFPVAVKEKLLKYRKDTVDWEVDIKQFSNLRQYKTPDLINDLEKTDNVPKVPENVTLHNYQEEAIKNWKDNNYCGIFDMATGTGKTYTGLGAIAKIFEDKKRLAVIIVCPYQHLVSQWVEDIVRFNINPIIGYSGSEQKDFKKRIKDAILDYNLKIRNFLCFVCTNSTFASEYIQKQIQNIKDDILLVVDEAHNFGALNLKKTLDTERYKYRLALSATLERHGDEEGTNALLSFFGKKCIEYSLDEAIENKFLTPYDYHPIVVYLTDDELSEYQILSKELSRCISKKNGKVKLSERGKIIAQQRSRLVAGAYNKLSKLIELMKEYKNDNHILVYCGATKIAEQDDDGNDIRQIDAITKSLGNELEMKVSQFTSKEDSSTRDSLRKVFAEGDLIQALIAIKCLDEGVNIPSIKTAFILASTTNPKEYIQRRGRVLRKFEGKEKAIIYDFVTLPRPLKDTASMTENEIKSELTMVRNEMNRVSEFKRLALNKMESDKLIDEIIEVYGINEFYFDDEGGLD
ncbi:MAG: DEAD/DEAH box helicase family protein [Bacilli bacterium]|nr:DEAD/DEAH box helicase family protein [Bacilli bacterium]